MKETAKDVLHLLKYILFNPGCTIVEIAAGLEFSEQYVIDMIKNITSNPVNRILLHTTGKNDLDKRGSHRKLKWKVEIENLDSIRVGYYMSLQEKNLLASLMICMGMEYEQMGSIGENTGKDFPESMLFCFNAPERVPGSGKTVTLLKKAIQTRKYISLWMRNSTEMLVLKPHCFIRDDITAEWFLACEDTDNQLRVIGIKKIGNVSIQNRGFIRTIPVNRDWSIRQNMKNNYVDTEILIQPFPWVEEKFKAQFKNNGSFKKLENGNILFTGTLYHKESLKVFLMRFGSAVQVLSPEWLRSEILTEARRVVKSIKKLNIAEQSMES
jgi:hypothetical protein